MPLIQKAKIRGQHLDPRTRGGVIGAGRSDPGGALAEAISRRRACGAGDMNRACPTLRRKVSQEMLKGGTKTHGEAAILTRDGCPYGQSRLPPRVDFRDL